MKLLNKYKLKSASSNTLAWAGLILGAVWSMFPILFIASSSIKPPSKIFEYPPDFVFRPTSQNYLKLFEEWPNFWSSLGNSAVITILAIALTLAIALPAAYAFSRFSRYRGVRSSGFFITAARMFPPVALSIPLFPFLRSVGLIDRHMTLIVLYAVFYVSIVTWILKAFLDSIPPELEESALIDGCSKFGSFMRITIPMVAPGLIAASALVGIFSWNEFFFAFLFTSTRAVTAPVVLQEMLGAMFGVSWGQLFAATTVQLIPVLVVLWAIQRFLLQGTAFGALK